MRRRVRGDCRDAYHRSDLGGFGGGRATLPERATSVSKKLARRSAKRAEQLLDEGDMAGAEWHRILNAIDRAVAS